MKRLLGRFPGPYSAAANCQTHTWVVKQSMLYFITPATGWKCRFCPEDLSYFLLRLHLHQFQNLSMEFFCLNQPFLPDIVPNSTTNYFVIFGQSVHKFHKLSSHQSFRSFLEQFGSTRWVSLNWANLVPSNSAFQYCQCSSPVLLCPGWGTLTGSVH